MQCMVTKQKNRLTDVRRGFYRQSITDMSGHNQLLPFPCQSDMFLLL
jgi:hypothetical protein